MSRTKVFFTEDKRHEWEPELRRLARMRCSFSTIGRRFGCSAQHLNFLEHIAAIIHEEWSRHDEEIVSALLEQARLQDDPAEEPSVRIARLNLKSKALSKLHDHIHKDIEALKAASELRLTLLSDEDLKNRVRLLVNKLGE